MMQSELLIHTSRPAQPYFCSNFDCYDQNMCFYEDGFFSSISSPPEYSLVSSESYDEMQNINTLDDVSRWLCGDDQEMKDIKSERFTKDDDVVEELNDVVEVESQSGLEHLLKAYADAMSVGQTELAKVIVKCVKEKINPSGSLLEKISGNLFRCGENQEEEYLNQESVKNFKKAFRAFYEIFPYGRFAHFTANSTILEAVPIHVESIHIVDFDLCEGSQWPSVIEAVARMKKSLIITSIKHEDRDCTFEETKWHLFNYARSLGVTLKVQEMKLGEIVKETERSEFVAFNCMAGLPHMGRTRKTTQVMEFLKVAKMVLAKNKGIITFADGEEGERMKNSSDFSSFFNENLAHFKALYESMECGFPSCFNEGRLAMETLFVAPFISSKSWFQKWEEVKENTLFLNDYGKKGQPMSMESLNEGRELVKEGESRYGIRIEGDNANEMVLEWNRIPLVRVSAWM